MSEEGENLSEVDVGLMPRRRRGKEPMLRMPSPLEEIRMSCLKGNLPSVQLLIKEGTASANEVFDDGWTALMVASNGAHPEVVKFLLDEGADPNTRRADGFSALMATMTSTKDERLVLECVQILLDAGADVNCQSELGLNPLQLALKDNRIQLVDLLISKGANINFKDKEGRTPLFYCAERGYIEIARRLLGKGAELGYQNGRRLSDISAAKGHLEVAEILRKAERSHKKTPGSKEVIFPKPSLNSPLSNPTSDSSEFSSIVDSSNNTQLPIDTEEVQSSPFFEIIDSQALPTVPVELKIDLGTTSFEIKVDQPPGDFVKIPELSNSNAFVPVSKELPISEVSKDLKETMRGIQGSALSASTNPPIQPSSSKRPEKNSERSKVLTAGLVFGVAFGLLIAYYARIYYLKR